MWSFTCTNISGLVPFCSTSCSRSNSFYSAKLKTACKKENSYCVQLCPVKSAGIYFCCQSSKGDPSHLSVLGFEYLVLWKNSLVPCRMPVLLFTISVETLGHQTKVIYFLNVVDLIFRSLKIISRKGGYKHYLRVLCLLEQQAGRAPMGVRARRWKAPCLKRGGRVYMKLPWGRGAGASYQLFHSSIFKVPSELGWEVVEL